MARVKLHGFEEFENQLAQLGTRLVHIQGQAIYAGADIVADAVKAQIQALPVSDAWGSPGNPRHGVTAVEKKGLLESFGIAPAQTQGYYTNVKLGFGGYNDDKTDDWPRGKPNVMIARAIESGTSWSDKHPFFNKALQASRKRAEERMKEVMEREIQTAMEG